METVGLAPRLAALKLVDAVVIEGRLLTELLPAAVDKLSPEDRARATRLAHECLRWMDRSDRILGPHLRKRPPPTVLNILRLAVFEMCQDKAAAHGVVNAAVSMTRGGSVTKSMAGLVNAVLRQVAKDGIENWETLPPPQLPKWLRKPLLVDYGKATIAAIEAAHAAGAPLDLTAKEGPEQLAKSVDGVLLPSGSVRVSGSPLITGLPGYAEGSWWVQDAAAAMPARLLGAQAGERVLDMCAAPGGKTLQLSQTGANVTSLDISEKRTSRIRENLERTGLEANVVVADALEFADDPFDAILLDAPCTATGTIRRHPDLPYAKNSEGFAAIFELQETLIDHAAKLLKPNGRLVFCTCSLLFDEGEEQIKDALVRNPNLKLDTHRLAEFDCPDDWKGELGIRTRPDFWPDLGGMDGFFMSVLQKLA